MEKALSGAALSLETLCAGLRALRGLDASHSGTDAAAGSFRGQGGKSEGLNVQLVQGMLLSALAPLLQDQVGFIVWCLTCEGFKYPALHSARRSGMNTDDSTQPPVNAVFACLILSQCSTKTSNSVYVPHCRPGGRSNKRHAAEVGC